MRSAEFIIFFGGANAVSQVPKIRLSTSSVVEDASIGTAIGTLSVSNGSGSYTFTITSDPDSKFAINGDGVTLETADTLDFETAASHLVTIEADNGVDDPITRQFTINVTNVLEVVDPAAPTLSWATTASDTTPDFDVGLPSSPVDGTETQVDDVLLVQYATAGTSFASPTTYVSHTIVSGDLSSGTISVTGSALSDGDYDFRARLERSGSTPNGFSDWTATESVSIDGTAPTASVFSPLDDATGVAIDANLTVQFDEDVQFAATVDISIHLTSDDSVVEAFDEGDVGTLISISGDTLTINPTADLDNSEEYYVLIDAVAIEDLAGNAFAGISSSTAWSFTTVASGLTSPQLITTAGGGSLIVPSGVTSITLEAWGAGGGGSGASSAAASGGAGGGYSKRVMSVTAGDELFYMVGAGGAGAAGNGTAGGKSWVNGLDGVNSEPTGTDGCVAAGGAAGGAGTNDGGGGTVGSTNFTGGHGLAGGGGVGGHGGGGAGSAEDGHDPSGGGGLGGSPDGGAGATGVGTGPGSNGSQPGGGGGGAWNSGSGSNGGDGQVKFSW